MTKDRILEVQQVAEQLLISEDAVKRLLRSKKLKGFKAGKFWRIYQSELEAYIQRQQNIK